MDDDAKKAILARRARFVAAAMMSAGMATCDRNCGGPNVCLSVILVPVDAAPQPCLSPPPLPGDAGANVFDADAGTGDVDVRDAGGDGGSEDAGVKDAGPRAPRGAPVPPPPPKPKPRPCLSQVPFE